MDELNPIDEFYTYVVLERRMTTFLKISEHAAYFPNLLN
jgi:hypothetical protein